MPDISDYLDSLNLGSQAVTITGKSMDGLVTGGFSAFIQAVTGKAPTLTQPETGKAKLTLSPDQAAAVRQWIDSQVWSAIMKPGDKTLDIDMNPVVLPLTLKYVLPASLALVAIGWLVSRYWR